MIDDPHLGDIYLDPQGKLWRCVVRVYEPTVTFEEVEGRTLSQGDCYRVLGGGQGQLGLQSQNQFVTGSQPQYYPSIVKERKSGEVSGLMWDGWKLIHRPEKPK